MFCIVQRIVAVQYCSVLLFFWAGAIEAVGADFVFWQANGCNEVFDLGVFE